MLNSTERYGVLYDHNGNFKKKWVVRDFSRPNRDRINYLRGFGWDEESVRSDIHSYEVVATFDTKEIAEEYASFKNSSN